MKQRVHILLDTNWFARFLCFYHSGLLLYNLTILTIQNSVNCQKSTLFKRWVLVVEIGYPSRIYSQFSEDEDPFLYAWSGNYWSDWYEGSSYSVFPLETPLLSLICIMAMANLHSIIVLLLYDDLNFVCTAALSSSIFTKDHLFFFFKCLL